MYREHTAPPNETGADAEKPPAAPPDDPPLLEVVDEIDPKTSPSHLATLTKLRSTAPEYRPRNTPTPTTTPTATGDVPPASATASLANAAALPPPMSATAGASTASDSDLSPLLAPGAGALGNGGLGRRPPPQHHQQQQQQHHHHHHGYVHHHLHLGHSSCAFVDYMLVVDFEATCEEHQPPGYTPEIIEFPVVVIDIHDRRVVGEFQSFVRPLEKPALSPFCMQLTGITQRDVDAAPPLQTVIHRFDRWLSGVIPEGKSFIFATDGPFDMCDFMYEHAVKTYGVDFPEYFYRWIDIKEAFSDFFGCRHSKIHAMLDHLGMKFEGRLHSGIDDARNIARIAIALQGAGCIFPTVDEIERTPPRQHLRRLSSTHRPAVSGSDTNSPATLTTAPDGPSAFELPPQSAQGSSSALNSAALPFVAGLHTSSSSKLSAAVSAEPFMPGRSGSGSSSQRPLNGNAVQFTPTTPSSSPAADGGAATDRGSTAGTTAASPYPFSYESQQATSLNSFGGGTPPASSSPPYGQAPPMFGGYQQQHQQQGAPRPRTAGGVGGGRSRRLDAGLGPQIDGYYGGGGPAGYDFAHDDYHHHQHRQAAHHHHHPGLHPHQHPHYGHVSAQTYSGRRPQR